MFPEKVFGPNEEKLKLMFKANKGLYPFVMKYDCLTEKENK